MRPVTIYCFHHAGGNPAGFRPLRAALAPEVDVVPLALERPGEVATIESIAEEVGRRLAGADLSDAHFYGHSMGGLVAYELCRTRAERGEPLPRSIVLAAVAPPGTLDPEGARAAALLRAGATVVPAPGLAERTTAGVRRSLAYSPPVRALPTPFELVHGTRDEVVTARLMRGWGEYTHGRLREHAVDDGHLFHRAPALAGLVRSLLVPDVPAPVCTRARRPGRRSAASVGVGA
ncbi:thioesterase II family protein [Oerskovia sp. NPDC057915]|uniref:thioesterase II family protein n=1 Tax=Oerskovia sp. NPDC057915 TaxID=3346280 RepID=UPI0036DE011E